MIKRYFYNKFLRDNVTYVMGFFLVGLLGYVFHFLISRQLSVPEYGELQSILALYAILTVFGSAVSYFITKHAAVFAHHKDYRANKEFISFFKKRFGKVEILFLVFFLVSSLWLSELLHLSNIWGLVFCILAVFYGLLFSVYAGELNAWENFLSFNSISFIAAFTKLVLGFILAVFFATASMVALSFFISALLAWYLARFTAQKKFLREGEHSAGKNWRLYFPNVIFKKVMLKTIVFSALFILALNLDVLIVKVFTTTTITGYYGALSLLGKMIFWINSAIIAVILPKAYAAGYWGKRAGKKVILVTYGLIVFLGLSAVLIYFLVPKLIVMILFGQRYVIFSGSLWLFALMGLISSLFSLEVNFSYAKDDFRVLYILGATVVFLILGIYIFHKDIQEIIFVTDAILLAGYAAALAINTLFKKQFSASVYEPIIPPQGVIIK